MTRSGRGSTSQGVHHLDDLDMQIIRELGGSSALQWNVRESFSNIARKLGVDEETVRMRVNRARERGFLPVWRIMVNPLLIDCQAANLDIEVKDEQHKSRGISKIKTLDGMNSIVDYRGKEITVGLYYEDDESLAHKTRVIEAICESPRLDVWTSTFPRPIVRMSQLDWRIISVMRGDARMELGEVAKSAGVSTRTVQRRLSALTGGRAVYLLRPPNVSVVGGLMCNFLVFCLDRGKKRSADRMILSTFNRIGASDTSSEQFSTFGIACENFSEADKVAERLKAVGGVQSVRMRVVKEIAVVEDWLSHQIAMRV